MVKLIVVLTSLLLVTPCQAKTITVDNDGPADFNNIQAAINDSNDGDTIIVADGTYTGDGNRDISFLEKAITLRSENGPENCIIDCNGTEMEPHRGFYFQSGEDANSVLYGFTITYGYAYGGSMLEGSSGGIYCQGSSPRIINCIISGNSAGYYGGGMSNFESSPMLINCIFSSNSANSGGGGIFNYYYSSPILINCILKSNSTIGNGGGMNNWHNSNPTIVNCTFNGNSTDMKDGGGMYNHESDPTLINCIFTGNSAYNCGGGIRNDGFSPPPTNNLFRDNLANDEDIMSNLGCDLILTNCTLFDNSATYGNAIACNSYGELRPSIVRLTNSILWNGGNEIWNNDNSTIIITYSSVQGGWKGLGNIDADPCFAVPNNGDYHLKSQTGRWDTNSQSWVQDDVTSPCIDAGNPGCPLGDESAPNGNRINMGAYGGTAEASKSPPNWRSIADMTNDGVVDSNDLRAYVDYWLESGECIPGDFDRSQFVDFNDFAIFGQNWSYPSALEPGIVYHVQDCNTDGDQNQPSAADSNDTRFTIWVEGSYIHFEDLITANCCLDEIELQMTIEDGLITIYEIEHLTTPCFCICDYPTTATLGPFEPGDYLLEVIDIDGESLGIVEVTIGGTTEPGITYQIEDCNLNASEIYIAEPPDPTRFTVTVEGSYIHFEDKMTANCCPDKLELDMTVEDNLITIYETEYTSDGCRCMCSFPITATLGPFEPGTYTLEVYETTGGFIGSTTITIDPGR